MQKTKKEHHSSWLVLIAIGMGVLMSMLDVRSHCLTNYSTRI